MTVTFVMIIGIIHTNIHQKAEKFSYNASIESLLILHLIWSEKSDFVGYPILSRTEFQQLDRLQKVITPKPFIVSGHAINHRKDKKVFYNSCNYIMFRFEPH
jgi:hypothetical protein